MSEGLARPEQSKAATPADTIALSQEERAAVRAILRRYLPPGTIVRIFGSRAHGTTKRFADLDLAIKLPSGPLDLQALAHLADALEESDLPFRTDLELLPAVFVASSRLLEVV